VRITSPTSAASAYLRAATPPLDDLEAALAKLAARRKP
jgi:hypothetical protein